MHIFQKKGDDLWLLFGPDETVKIGDVFAAGDFIVQVTDIEFANTPGILEHMLRLSLIAGKRVEEQPQADLRTFLDTLVDQRLAVAKIRGTAVGGKFRTGFASFDLYRSNAPIRRLPTLEVMSLLQLDSKYAAEFGSTLTEPSEPFPILLDRLGIQLITGMKGSGKSYGAKKLMLRLIEAGSAVVVLDINGEYVNLWRHQDGSPGDYAAHIRVLRPRGPTGANVSSLSIPLEEVGYGDFAGYVGISAETQMFNELIVFWEERKGPFDLADLEGWVRQRGEEELIHEASAKGILGKIRMAKALRIFGPCDFKGYLSKAEERGGAVIIDLSRSQMKEREILVKFVLRQLVDFARSEGRPLSLFAEEAQLYVTEEMWDDLLTRMRHHGVYPTFITNDPGTLPDEVFSLCDNVISFSFHNQDDLRQVARAKVIDQETLNLLRHLERGQCVLVGNVSGNFPLMVGVTSIGDVMVGGETRRLLG